MSVEKIQQGTIVIALKGEVSGKRVVYLGEMDEDTAIISGPSEINDVGITTIAKKNIIITSQKLELGNITVTNEIKSYLKKVLKSKKDKKVEETVDFIEFKNKTNENIIKEVEKIEFLSEYLKTKFTLKEGELPHKMKF
eukprot:GHVP01022690.1.p1 GENE.GHVP01022690.1~~GHVP01022690.1.p1  ORF type:complete len:139 (+),score=28.52 GHVP01022690.1:748-1164(+)